MQFVDLEHISFILAKQTNKKTKAIDKSITEQPIGKGINYSEFWLFASSWIRSRVLGMQYLTDTQKI